MAEAQALIDLPFETLAALGAGYIGYRLAYVGQDQKHKTIDVAFISLAFGLIYRLPALLVLPQYGHPAALVLAGLVLTLLCASAWRVRMRKLTLKCLRAANISNSDGTHSAWDSIRVSTENRPTQLVIRQKDGPALMCDYLHNFEGYPQGPCIWGEDGSVAMYITHIKMANDEEWIPATWTETELGAQITYIPTEQITSIEVRNLTT